MLSYACFLAVIISVKTAKAPFIKPCKADDQACVLSSAQAAVPHLADGVPDLGIKSLDPMHIPLISSDQGGLQLTFKDTVMTGMKGCTFDDIKVDLTKMKQTMVIRCSVMLQGDYKLSGHLIVLPVQGEGNYTITIDEIVIKVNTELSTETGSDGKPHWHISSWKESYDVKKGAHFQFNNLFNGNKILAEPVETFLNTNWHDVTQEVAPPIVQATVAGVTEAVEALYKAVPADELYIS